MGYALDPDNPLYADGKAAPAATPPATATAEADLDFNLDVPGTESAPAAPAAPAPAPAETGPLDFEIEVPKADAAPSPAPAPARAASALAEAPPLDFKLDLAALDLSLDDKKSGAAPAGERDAHWHDVQAKFDLAKAYEEMGDKAGAREILKEVMQEGDAEQQTKAKTLLDALG
jgi:pilus assembly protein FimV